MLGIAGIAGCGQKELSEAIAGIQAISLGKIIFQGEDLDVLMKLCGLGGAYLSLVYVPAWQESVTAGRGWIAVAQVIFAAWNPYKAILGDYLFGGLDILGFTLQGAHVKISQY